ncbi:hypothetical protein BSL78_20546 [Apostichopus japonicus]|uniref:Uncharacterized protein n=1 Tax=Stichopus japonicus TaxID=307972 RepID=A0A2G8K3R3_STIJA|nr:hypothetical protein BSL78_20546 [Apostichopus japonicus]
MNATCNATGARPAAQISWRHNDREVLSNWQRTSSSRGTEDVTTYSTEAALTVQTREDNGTISCIVSGLEVLNDYKDQRSIAIGIAVTALAVILLGGILVIIFRSGFDRKLPQPPVSELPNAAVVNSESSSYQTLPCEEHMYYSTIKTMATHNRVFQAKDMCLIINLTKGLIYDRWMGTISVSKTDKKCVVITAVNESATQRADIHWDLFVKRVLELPHNMHLVKVEGICIEEEKLFLIQEHLSCEPLSSFLSNVEQQDYSLTTKYELHLKQRLTFARFILEGINILHSNGITCNLNVSAPESYLRKEYDQKSDVWSMAVVIWELITENSVFRSRF